MPSSRIPWPTRKPKRKKKALPWPVEKPCYQSGQSGNNGRSLKAKQPTQDIGNQAEQDALAFLVKQGLELVEQNYQAKCGEIDLIVADGQAAIVVEVRFRRNAKWGGAAASVNWEKQRKIKNCAQLWWQAHGQHHFESLRYDVVAFEGNDKPVWLKGAFL